LGCPQDTSITIISEPIPNMAACCDAIILAGNDTILFANGNTTKPYQWSPQVMCLNPPLCDSVKVSPTITTTYTVTLTDSLGCQVERILTVLVEIPCSNFTVPNVFTPNNAGPLGINNVFYIKTSGLNSWSIMIYDRWGMEMYNSSNPDEYWNGDTRNVSKAPDGVYYYIIHATCGGTTYKKDGFVQLIR
jgi:gliding motility-associated-like protein